MSVFTGFPTGVENVPLGALQVSIGGAHQNLIGGWA